MRNRWTGAAIAGVAGMMFLSALAVAQNNSQNNAPRSPWRTIRWIGPLETADRRQSAIRPGHGRDRHLAEVLPGRRARWCRR